MIDREQLAAAVAAVAGRDAAAGAALRNLLES
jgi:hypothetical protein